MRRTAVLAFVLLAPMVQSQDDPLTQAQAILSRVGPAPTGNLRVEALAPAPMAPAKPAVAGTWATSTNEWEFRADGTWQIVGTRNKGQWKETSAGIAIQYSGASAWINLKFVGNDLVDQDGFIGRATLKKK